MIGKFATSKSGHDKGNIYVIIGEETDYVYVADGKLKTVDKPKRKNKKHIQIINKVSNEMNGQKSMEGLPKNKDFRNEEIKRAIKLYSRSNIEGDQQEGF
ncbi:KOW domain-containing RNA-binding protein [Lachnospiraceae bacterium ZAX-1]